MNRIKTIHTFMYYIGSVYLMSKGHECNANEVIISEDVCKLAADTLALDYTTRVNVTFFPAGCYWGSSSDWFPPTVYYNEPTTVSAKAAYTDDRGGICRAQGIRFILTLLKLSNQYSILRRLGWHLYFNRFPYFV